MATEEYDFETPVPGETVAVATESGAAQTDREVIEGRALIMKALRLHQAYAVFAAQLEDIDSGVKRKDYRSGVPERDDIEPRVTDWIASRAKDIQLGKEKILVHIAALETATELSQVCDELKAFRRKNYRWEEDIVRILGQMEKLSSILASYYSQANEIIDANQPLPLKAPAEVVAAPDEEKKICTLIECTIRALIYHRECADLAGKASSAEYSWQHAYKEFRRESKQPKRPTIEEVISFLNRYKDFTIGQLELERRLETALSAHEKVYKARRQALAAMSEALYAAQPRESMKDERGVAAIELAKYFLAVMKRGNVKAKSAYSLSRRTAAVKTSQSDERALIEALEDDMLRFARSLGAHQVATAEVTKVLNIPHPVEPYPQNGNVESFFRQVALWERKKEERHRVIDEAQARSQGRSMQVRACRLKLKATIKRCRKSKIDERTDALLIPYEAAITLVGDRPLQDEVYDG